MPSVARRGDRVSLLFCGDTLSGGSNNVLINNRLAIRAFIDLSTGHPVRCQPVPVIVGSPSVFVNNYPIARVGDKQDIHCRHNGIIETGSLNVFANNS